MTENVKQTSYGYEATWAKTDSYYSKIVGFNKPNKTSMHFHKVKNKSWFINDGNFKLNYIDTATGALFESNLKEGQVFNIPALMPASIECLSPSGSFTEVGDIDDDADIYNFTPTGEELAHTSTA